MLLKRLTQDSGKEDGFIMNTYSNITNDELVLQHCLRKIKTPDRDQALVYGQLSGFLDNSNKITPSGANLVKFLKLDLAHERVG